VRQNHLKRATLKESLLHELEKVVEGKLDKTDVYEEYFRLVTF
jgi:hypothetical protein